MFEIGTRLKRERGKESIFDFTLVKPAGEPPEKVISAENIMLSFSDRTPVNVGIGNLGGVRWRIWIPSPRCPGILSAGLALDRHAEPQFTDH
jgi:hypothetical protein